MKSTDKLIEFIQQLESKKPNLDSINLSISKATVGWQIEHSLLTINLIVETLKKSNPKDYKWKFSFPRMMVLIFNKIPRGRAESPNVVQPKDNITMDLLSKHFLITKQNINELDNLDDNSYFTHPYFGKLKLKETIKFLEIHTTHHLQIINDINKKIK